MSNVCVGMISGLPDDEKLRSVRKSRLQALVNDLNLVLNSPIIIVAQNGTDEDLSEFSSCTIFSYKEKLGITKARIVLREKLLNTKYEGVIFIDDDIKILPDIGAGNKYKAFLEGNRYNIIEYDNFLFNLLYMPMTALRNEPFINVDPEKGEAYEDGLYILILRNKYKVKMLKINHSHLKLLDYVNRSEQANDTNSTGFHNQFDKKKISDDTLAMFKLMKRSQIK